ncbi:MAG: flagellar motor protein MotB [Elusimicrobiota bacterium]
MSKSIREAIAVRKRMDWQIIYVNLMTLLMIFFMVIYSMESVGQATGRETDYERVIGVIQGMFGGESNVLRVSRAERRDKEKRLVEDLKSLDSAAAEVEVTREKIKVTMPSPVLFDSGSADLRPESVKVLGGLASRLRSLEGNRIVIEGHTDDKPLLPGSAFKDNFELSARRALGILYFLTEQGGMPPASLTPVGYGEFRPAAPNTSAANRAKNRRIEIHIIREK